MGSRLFEVQKKLEAEKLGMEAINETWMEAVMLGRNEPYIPRHLVLKNYSLEVQRPLKGWVFTKDHYFSRDLQSTIPRDYYFNGL